MGTLELHHVGNSALDHARIEQLARIVIADAGFDNEQIDLGIHMVSAAEIHELNRTHRDVDSVTDVLSFPIDGTDSLPAGMARQLGDVIICQQYVEQQFADGANIGGGTDTTLERALERCIVHGMLHLLGMDHETDDDFAAMRNREDMLLAQATETVEPC